MIKRQQTWVHAYKDRVPLQFQHGYSITKEVIKMPDAGDESLSLQPRNYADVAAAIYDATIVTCPLRHWKNHAA